MNIKNINQIPKGIEKALEAHNRLTESLQPVLEQQKRIEEITARANINKPHLRIDNPILKPFESFQSPALQFASHLSEYQVAPGVTSALESIGKVLTSPVYEKIGSFANRFGEMIQNNLSPAIQWLQSIEYNPIISFLQSLDFDKDALNRCKELNKAYLQAMYDCKWFPYAGWSADIRMFDEVNDILSSSRGISKRCINRIDKAIFSYYTDSEIRDIKRSWKKSDNIEPHIKRMLGQAINAHLRGEYALTITCLATLWEGLIHKKCNITGRHSGNKTKQDFKELITDNEFEPIFADFYENMIVSQCDTPEDVIEGVPNRNGISHSKYKKYPNKKASLNAILLTDFIINLSPIDFKEAKTEEV